MALSHFYDMTHPRMNFYGGISEAWSCDGGQSEICFLCVLNLGGQSIVFSLLFWSLSSTTWTMLFLLPLGPSVWDCPSLKYLAHMLSLIIPWFAVRECSVVDSLSLSGQNKQSGKNALPNLNWFDCFCEKTFIFTLQINSITLKDNSGNILCIYIVW